MARANPKLNQVSTPKKRVGEPNNEGKNPHAKFDHKTRIDVKAYCVKLHNRGYSYRDIATQVYLKYDQEISFIMVGVYIREVKEEAKLPAKQLQEEIDQKVDELREVRKESYRAWDKSKNPTFLHTVLECIRMEIDLKGIAAPERIEVNSKTQTLDWGSFFTQHSPAVQAPTKAIGAGDEVARVLTMGTVDEVDVLLEAEEAKAKAAQPRAQNDMPEQELSK